MTANPQGRFRLPVRGDILRLGDEDYKFGRGPLTLRVMLVHEVRQMTDGPWLFLRGTSLRADGSEIEQRDVLVSVAALRRQRPAGR
jgi:hypothetical protein